MRNVQKPNLYIWICGWCEIIDGLCNVLTFGSYYPGLTFKYAAWATIRDLKRAAQAAIES